jgi:hypothetical protein
MSPFIALLHRWHLLPKKRQQWHSKTIGHLEDPVPARLKVEVKQRQIGETYFPGGGA